MGAMEFRSIAGKIGKAAVAGAIVAVAIVCAPAQAQTAGTADPHARAQQPSPQGQTGPVNTGSGGTTPASPQGETPPDMQAQSPGATDAPKGK